MNLKKAIGVMLAVSLACSSTLSTVAPVFAEETTTNVVTVKQEQVNWFVDGGFENADLKQLDALSIYTSWPTDKFTSSVATITNDDGTTNNVMTVVSEGSRGNQKFDITGLSPNTEYTLKFKAKTDANTVTCGISAYKTGDASGAEDIPYTLTTEWKDYEVTFTTGSVDKVTFFVWNKLATTSYFDDFEFMYTPNENSGNPDDEFNNNPENEVLNETPDYFPVSDADNTMNWALSETMSDEFDGDSLDTTKWFDKHQYWVGREPSYFKTDNVRVEDGKAILTSGWGEVKNGTQTFDAACIQSKQKTGYGYYEIKSMTAPISMTSSFWLQGKTKEVDVFEQIGRAKKGHDSDEYPTNTHDFADGWDNDITNPFTYKTGIDLTLDYHVYGFEWGPDYLKFYFDGKLIRTIENKVFNESMFVFCDMETFVWNGFPEEEDFYTYIDPNTGKERYTGDYYVDYVRVWRTDEKQNDDYPEIVIPDAKETVASFGTPADITADGKVDAVWEKAEALDSFGIVSGGLEKLKAKIDVKTMWDNEYLYILSDVEDPDVFVNSKDKWNGDCIDLYFDYGNEKDMNGFDSNDFSIKVMPDGVGNSASANAPEGIVYSSAMVDDGYVSQVAIPWDSLDVAPGTVIGFDAQLNEGASKTAQREAIVVWNDTTGNLWKNFLTIGDLKLGDIPVVEPTAPVEPTNVVAKQTSDSVINVSWDAVEGADGYVVYRVVNGKDVYYRTVKNGATNVSNGGKVADTTYTYKVRAYTLNSQDKKLYSEFVETSCTTDKVSVDLTKVKIENLKAVATSTARIEVSWDKAENVEGYEVYRVVNGKDYLYKTITATSLGNAGKVADTTYTYKVRGYAVSEGEKVYTDFATVTCTTPSK